MVGKIAYDESNVAEITAWVPGRLDKLYADFTGITVKKGDRLVYMYSPQLLAAQEELLQARAAIASLGKTTSDVLRSTAATTLDAVRNKLRLFGLTSEQIINIETSGRASEHLTIYSPVGGVVIRKDAKEGMYVSTGTRIYAVADLAKLWVTFEAYESDLPWLRYGQRAEFTVPSLPGELFEASLSYVDPFVDPETRTVAVRAVVDNRDGRLKPDTFVRGMVRSRINDKGEVVDGNLADKWISPVHPEVIKSSPGSCDICGRDLIPASSLGYVSATTPEENAPLLIPSSAPLITGKRAVVYVASSGEDGPTFNGREVVLGPRAGDFYIVKSGVESGESVMSNGAFRIDSELQIQAKPSMMSPSGGGGKQQHDHSGMHADTPVEMVTGKAGPSDAAQKELTPVYDAYFGVQMALAKDDLKTAKKAGATLSEAVKKVAVSVFTHEDHKRWMELSKQLSASADKVAKAENIEKAREAFVHLSEATIELHGAFGHAANRNFYLTHCPMARAGKGTYWLQTENLVWNSMYGKEMLRCGSIKKTFAPNPDKKSAGE